jgi:hypothetical protein
MNTVTHDARRVFLKKGTCSQTLCYLLDREFGHVKENEERATDPLAGGIMQKGHQCGMLWGSALAAGAESFRRHADRDQAIGMAIAATQNLAESFTKRTNTVNCREITGGDWTSPASIVKYFLTGRIFTCFNLTAKWAPEAIRAAKAGLSRDQKDLPEQPLSCASEVVKKMGGSDEEMVRVAGFAGGIGLGGHACGALGAAIWMRTLAWCKEHPGKTPPYFNSPNTKNTLKAFAEATGSEFLCHRITGQRFKTIGEHTEFIKSGGCDKLIQVLARSQATATESN